MGASLVTISFLNPLYAPFLLLGYTIVIVTHSMQQASRISDDTAFFLLGEMIEFSSTKELFSTPMDERTENYITGRFG